MSFIGEIKYSINREKEELMEKALEIFPIYISKHLKVHWTNDIIRKRIGETIKKNGKNEETFAFGLYEINRELQKKMYIAGIQKPLFCRKRYKPYHEIVQKIDLILEKDNVEKLFKQSKEFRQRIEFLKKENIQIEIGSYSSAILVTLTW